METTIYAVIKNEGGLFYVELEKGADAQGGDFVRPKMVNQPIYMSGNIYLM